jgi:RsiW-degrading membrane proteinase PrsW (M82 family)
MTDHYVSTELLARFYGAALCGIGLLFWFIKDVNDQSILKNIGYVALACGVVGFVVTMIGVAGTPVIREKAWLPITLHIVFALIYGYLVFLAPKNSSN